MSTEKIIRITKKVIAKLEDFPVQITVVKELSEYGLEKGDVLKLIKNNGTYSLREFSEKKEAPDEAKGFTQRIFRKDKIESLENKGYFESHNSPSIK